MTLTTRKIDDVVIIDIEGKFRRSEVKAPSLSGIVKGQLEEGKKKLLINLEKLDFVDSFGVGEILTSYILVQEQGGKLKLAAVPWNRFGGYPSESLPRDFLYSSIEDALADFCAPKKTIKKWWQLWKF